MNVEFVPDHVQIWKNEEEDEPDYAICFTRRGVYVTIGMDMELMEHLRQWLNNIHGSTSTMSHLQTSAELEVTRCPVCGALL